MTRDFPKSELRPYWNMRSLLRRGIYECFGLYENNELQAYACMLRADGHLLLDYYAVLPPLRGSGIGGNFLRSIAQNCNANGILLEVESPRAAENAKALEICNRRIAFYQRNGAHLTRVSGMVWSADFTVMYIPVTQDMNDTEVLKAIMSIYQHMIPARWLKKVRYKID